MNYVLTNDKRQAFIVRLPGEMMKGNDWVLLTNVLNMGWQEAKGLTNEDLCYKEFRDIIHKTYFLTDRNYRRSGRLAGTAWRFIREMNIGNYALLPIEDGFYITKVTSDAFYDANVLQEKRGYKRTVEVLNNAKPVLYESIPPKLREKLSSSHPITDVSELMQEIEFSIRNTENHKTAKIEG
jgi:predicted Mrr-cat superfamily restriction endonuclease